MEWLKSWIWKEQKFHIPRELLYIIIAYCEIHEQQAFRLTDHTFLTHIPYVNVNCICCKNYNPDDCPARYHYNYRDHESIPPVFRIMISAGKHMVPHPFRGIHRNY